FFSARPRRPPPPTLFPYTTLFRSCTRRAALRRSVDRSAGFCPIAPRARQTLLDGARAQQTCRSAESARIHRRAAARKRTSSLRRSEEHTSELQSRENLVCRLLLEK